MFSGFAHNFDLPVLADDILIHQKLTCDLRYFSKRVLKVIDKNAKKVFMKLNTVQEIVHRAVEEMLAELGWVRIIIVKGRQQGCSQYVSARFYHKAITNDTTKVFILTHEAAATNVLFNKVSTYHNNAPEAVAPGTDTENRKQLGFDNGSLYTVATAGAENTGRSDTAFLAHFSEPAFYPNPKAFKTGAAQAVSDVPGSEIIYESTCNGINWWYNFVIRSLKGETGFRVLFIPWYITPEYRSKAPEGFKLTAYEYKLKMKYRLDNDQINWRRQKIAFFETEGEGDGERMFKQEYPFTLVEAFQQSGNSFYDPDKVDDARQSKITDSIGPIVIGVDPGRMRDRTCITIRKGRIVLQIIKLKPPMNNIKIANVVADLIEQYNADKVFIDWGKGDGVIDILHGRNYRHIVEGVNFGEEADNEIYLNKRAEMFFRFRDWLHNQGEVRLPDDDDMAMDINMLPDYITTATGKIKFHTKDELKKLLAGKSPDILDSIALTFAHLVRAKDAYDGSGIGGFSGPKTKGGSRTLANIRGERDNTRRDYTRIAEVIPFRPREKRRRAA